MIVFAAVRMDKGGGASPTEGAVESDWRSSLPSRMHFQLGLIMPFIVRHIFGGYKMTSSLNAARSGLVFIHVQCSV